MVGVWSEWGTWGACSKECDNGIQQRNRTCTTPEAECVGDATEERVCNTEACPGNEKLQTFLSLFRSTAQMVTASFFLIYQKGQFPVKTYIHFVTLFT